jgi:hypothetical protein
MTYARRAGGGEMGWRWCVAALQNRGPAAMAYHREKMAVIGADGW